MYYTLRFSHSNTVCEDSVILNEHTDDDLLS